MIPDILLVFPTPAVFLCYYCFHLYSSIFIISPLPALSLAARQTAGGGEAAGRGARSSEGTEAAVWGETKRPRTASRRPAAQTVPGRRTGRPY